MNKETLIETVKKDKWDVFVDTGGVFCGIMGASAIVFDDRIILGDMFISDWIVDGDVDFVRIMIDDIISITETDDGIKITMPNATVELKESDMIDEMADLE